MEEMPLHPSFHAIFDDFERICRFIKLEGYQLKLVDYHNEGFCDDTNKIIYLGISDGYKRLLLIHECLHGIGYNHNSKNFSGNIKHDKVSPMFERWIFGLEEK